MMTPVIHCSAGNIHFFPRPAFFQRREISIIEHNVCGNYTRQASPSQRFLLRQSSFCRFPSYRTGFFSKHGPKIQSIAAVGADVTVEESNPAVSDEELNETTEAPTNSVETAETAPANPVGTSNAKTRRSRPPRRSEMPRVKDEDLAPGASFTGKVRSIQPFGAFVDFGAFTDGLVHVSRMSDGYVQDVSSLVSVGQEVKVRIVEANMETGRISLTMRENDDARKIPQRRETTAGASSDRPRPARKNAASQKRDEQPKTTKFVKGQVLTGTVKNTIRSGSFVSLPEGEEGFIPVSEESEGYGNVSGSSSLQVGQEVNVRVLRIARGKVTLTMKKEEDVEELNKQLNKGVWHAATNPFELAFRNNKDIASFLDEQERARKSSEKTSLPDNTVEIADEVDDAVTESDDVIVDGPVTSEEVIEETPSADSDTSTSLSGSLSDSDVAEVPVENDTKDSSASVDTIKEQIGGSEVLISENSEPAASMMTDVAPITDEGKEADTVAKSAEANKEDSSSEASVLDEVPVAEEVKETVAENATVSEDGESSNILSSQENEDSADPSKIEASAEEIGDPGIPESPNGQTANPDQASAVKAISPALVKQLREETGAGMMDCKKALTETGGDIVKAQEFLRKKGLASADTKSSRATAEGRVGSYIHDGRIGVLIEVNCETDFVSRGEIFKQLVDDLAMQVAACPQVQHLATEDVPEEIVNKEREIEMMREDLLSKPEQIRSQIVDGRIGKRLAEFALLEQPFIKNDKVVVKDWVKQTIATIGENIKVKRFARYNLGEGLEKKSQDFAAEVAAQTAAKESPPTTEAQPVETTDNVEKPPAVAVSAALVKQLRDDTGAGMMDCKKALTETGGDLEKAQEYLRKKGLSSADKKSSRLAAEGRISSYIHDARIGCLIEVNSETDFVARNEKFKELVADLAMQVVACPQVEFVSVEDIPKEIVDKEKEVEMGKEDLKSKPEHIREKIVEGRISKRLGELALLEQPFIRDDKVTVKELVQRTVAALGENIKVRRFVRFTLGENKD